MKLEEIKIEKDEDLLPENYSDDLLDYLEKNIRKDLEGNNLLGEKEENESQNISFYLITSILAHQNNFEEFELSPENLIEKYTNLLMEVSLEILTRRTEINIERPTLDNVLTNRDISMDRRAIDHMKNIKI